MKKTALSSLLLTIMLISTVIPFSAGGEEGTTISQTLTTGTEEVLEGPSILESEDGYLDVRELARAGIGDLRTIDMKDPENMRASVCSLDWLEERRMNALMDSPMAEETDSFDAPFFAEDGDKISNNVTSTISGTSITFDDEDYYQVNLTVDGPNITVEKLELIVTSAEAEEKNASLTIEAFHVNILLGQWMDGGFESVGKYHGNSTKFVFVPDGDRAVNYVYPLMFRFRSWNSTMLNFTFEVKITDTTRTEWNALGPYGTDTRYNSTNKPARMQSINRSHDYIDWFDLSGTITDKGLDRNRNDLVQFSMKVDVATEERGSMYNPFGLYGTVSPTTSVMFIYLVWLNYTDQSLSIYNIDGNLPYASMLFNRDPVSLGFEDHADHVWIGMTPLALWGSQNGFQPPAEGNAELFFNLTSINTKIIPPNGPPRLDLSISDQVFYEDEGPWVNITDLDDYFSDPQPEHNAMLRYEVEVVDADTELHLSIADDGMLSVKTLEDNYYGSGDFRIKCFDWGPDWIYNSNDDLETSSNTFNINILPVNDDAYIEKVDVQAGTVKNKHEPIHITIPQGFSGLKSKKIFAYDNDTEDQGRLEYEHNATTPSFSINANGQYSFIPTNEDVGTHWIKATVDDGRSPSEDDYIILVFHITNRNDAPELRSVEWRDMGIVFDDLIMEDTPTFRHVQEDLEINLTLEAYDADIDIGIPDKLQWIIGSAGWEAHPYPSNPMKTYLTYTPTNDDASDGMVSTTLQVMDSQNAQSQEITIELYVDNANDDPRILSINQEFPVDGKVDLNTANEQNGFEDRMYTITVIAEEIDPRDDVTFTVNDPAWQQSQVMGNEMARNFSMMPTQDMIGNHSLRITVSDEDGAADSVLVTYQIVNTNDPPNKPVIKFDSSQIMYTEIELIFWVQDEGDPDDDPLEFIWDFGDGSEKVKGDQVTHVYTAAKSFTITVYAEDPSGVKSQDATTYISTIEKPVIIDPNLDTDGDGMTDIYEDENGLDKNDGNDKFQDKDEDGFKNYDEYVAGTDPLNPKDHPEREVQEDSGLAAWVWIVIAFFVILLLVALGFFLFVVMAKPKTVQQQQMYGAELPGAAAPQLPPQPQQQLQPASSPQLPPAKEEEKEPEEDLLDSFMEEAQKQMVDEETAPEEENVWRPPTPEAAPEEESQVDDLFSDDTGEKPPTPAEKPEGAEPPKEESVPKPPQLPDLPPPPTL